MIFFSKVSTECLQHCSAQPHCQQQTRQWNTGVKDTEGERTTEPTELGSNLVSLSFSVRFLFAIITDIRNGSQGMLEFLYFTIFQPSLCFRITLTGAMASESRHELAPTLTSAILFGTNELHKSGSISRQNKLKRLRLHQHSAIWLHLQ